MNQVFVFIYSNGEKIKALNVEQAKVLEDSLLEEGWKHTKTIDACAWIQYLCNSCEDLDDEIMSMF